MAEQTFVKPVCPKCGRKNVRHRTSMDKPYLCVLCGNEGTAEDFGVKQA